MEPLLLPLPTNEQQRRILELAQRHPGVTVQGPPGTGKSHTIANLISHYVAYGHRVLVVAEKEQALRVLADKVPAGIRDLTVSVLGADEEGRRRLETSILNIQTGVNQVDRGVADARIRDLDEQLRRVDGEFAETTTRMLRARRVEVEPLAGTWQAGDALSPQQAAEWVNQRTADLSYIPDVIPLTAPPPLTTTELIELTMLAADIEFSTALRAVESLPDPQQLPTADEFRSTTAQMQRLEEVRRRVRPAVHSWDKLRASTSAAVQGLVDDLGRETAWRQEVLTTWVGAVLRQLDDPMLRNGWLETARALSVLRGQAIELRQTLTAFDIKLPDQRTPDFVRDLHTARDRLQDNGKLGFFDREPKRAIAACLVDGSAPTTIEHVIVCIQAVRLEDLRRAIVTRWSNETGPLGGPALVGPPEEALFDAHLQLESALSARDRWDDLAGRLRACGFQAPERPDIAQLATVARIASDSLSEFSVTELTKREMSLAEELRCGSEMPGASILWRQLGDSLERRDENAWRSALADLDELRSLAPRANRLVGLRNRLAKVAPGWAERLVRRSASVDGSTDTAAAWQWRQLDSWLRTIAASPSPSVLQARLEELAAERRRLVTDLVTERAWRRLADNIGVREQQALQTYIRALTRYGKTGGKFAQRWITEMREALDDAKTAVPVWIMPTSRALTSFRPTAVPPFDVIIIDEASQIGFEALPVLALGRSVIVVGDDKQTSPENVGLNRQEVFDLMDDHLRDVPKYRTLFDPDNSLYDLATQRFSTPVMLTEHFRCLPEIIEFSNSLAYDGRIVPLRDRAPAPGWSPLGLVRVLDGHRSGDVNEPEAAQVVTLIERMCADPAYDGMTFGVVSLLGTSQSKRIFDLLLDRLGQNVVLERQIRSGEPATFQGDERDVMILSTVVAVDPSVPGARIGPMTGNAALRRFNVAASRARNQMWVVTSVDEEQLPNGDLRAELIRHCRSAQSLVDVKQDLLAACESEFERRVVGRLLTRGYRAVRVQVMVGRYRIDIVVEGPDGRLAVECDGDRWHGEDTWHRDRARQEVLERAGWTFERIRGSAFFRDPDNAMEPVWKRLDAMNIPTGDDWMVARPRSVVEEVGSAVPSSAGESLGGATEVEQQSGAAVPPPVETSFAPPSWYLQLTDDRRSVQARDETGGLAQDVVVPFDAVHRAQPRTMNGSAPSKGILGPYQEWAARPLPSVDTASRKVISLHLADIVAAEGPMHARRAFQLYVRGSGGSRLGRELERMLSSVLASSLGSRQLARIVDTVGDSGDRTIFLPGTEPVVIRDRGPRELVEIPRSEIRSLITALGVEDKPADVVKREVLTALGLVRQTARANSYLSECLSYEWTT